MRSLAQHRTAGGSVRQLPIALTAALCVTAGCEGCGSGSSPAPSASVASAPTPSESEDLLAAEPPSAGDLIGAAPLAVRTPPGGMLDAIAVSPDGWIAAWCEIACLGKSEADGRVHVFDDQLAHRTITVSPPPGQPDHRQLSRVVWAADRGLAASNFGSVSLWDREGNPVWSSELYGVYDQFRFSPDHTRVLAAGVHGTAELVDAVSGKPIKRLQNHDGAAALQVAIHWSGDGKTAVLSHYDGRIQLWTAAGETSDLGEPRGGLADVAFAPDGSTLAIAPQDGTFELWSLSPPTLRKTLYRETEPTADDIAALALEPPAELVRFSPDGKRLASLHRDGAVRIWDATSGAAVEQLAATQANASDDDDLGPMLTGWTRRAIAFSPDGRFLAWGTARDGSFQLWRAASEDEPRTLRQIEGLKDASIVELLWSADSSHLAVSDGRHSEIWDPDGGTMRHRTISTGPTGASSRAFSADNKMLIIADGEVQWQRIADGSSLVLRRIGDEQLLYTRSGLYEGDPALCTKLLRHRESDADVDRSFTEAECAERRRKDLAGAFMAGTKLTTQTPQ